MRCDVYLSVHMFRLFYSSTSILYLNAFTIHTDIVYVYVYVRWFSCIAQFAYQNYSIQTGMYVCLALYVTTELVNGLWRSHKLTKISPFVSSLRRHQPSSYYFYYYTHSKCVDHNTVNVFRMYSERCMRHCQFVNAKWTSECAQPLKMLCYICLRCCLRSNWNFTVTKQKKEAVLFYWANIL